MCKRVLMVATVPSMIGQFNMNNIQILQDLGYEIDVACDFTDTSVWTSERVLQFKNLLKNKGIEAIQLDFSRSPLKIRRHLKSYNETVKLIRSRKYSFIHTHTPIASAIVRQAAHKTCTKVIYTAHGFHFYDGAPLKNWLIFYPIEKWFSRYTDVLITINKEDYKRASERFNAKKNVYIPGVGVDIEKFAPRKSGRERIRAEFGISENRIILLSIGDLNEITNYESVIKLIRFVENITYVIVGECKFEQYLKSLASEFYVDLIFAGKRSDVADFYDAADIYIHPSVREDKYVNLLEAMASSLPCIVGNSFDKLKNSLQNELLLNAEERKEEGNSNFHSVCSFDLRTIDEVCSVVNQEEYAHLREVFERQTKRLEIGVPLDCKLIISVGELSVRKNHRVIVEALQNLPDDYWYVIVGKGELKDKLEKMDLTNRVKLLGFRTDIVELLHSSDLFVFPSIQEGLPVALMEAMAAGMNVLVSNIRGNSDLVEQNCVSTMDVSDWRNEILNSIKSDNSVNNLEKIQAFSTLKVNEQMKDLYENIER